MYHAIPSRPAVQWDGMDSGPGVRESVGCTMPYHPVLRYNGTEWTVGIMPWCEGQCGMCDAVPSPPAVQWDGMDSWDYALVCGTVWDVPCCTIPSCGTMGRDRQLGLRPGVRDSVGCTMPYHPVLRYNGMEWTAGIMPWCEGQCGMYHAVPSRPAGRDGQLDSVECTVPYHHVS